MKIISLRRTAQTEDAYTNTITPAVYLPASAQGTWMDVVSVSSCTLKYRIDVEHRSWGIKGITVTLDPSPIVVEVEVRAEVGPENAPQVSDETKRIVVDPKLIPVEMVAGDGVVLSGMELHLNPDFTVDYKMSSIEGYTLTRD